MTNGKYPNVREYPGSQTYLAVDNDWAIDVGAQESAANGVEVSLQRGG